MQRVIPKFLITIQLDLHTKHLTNATIDLKIFTVFDLNLTIVCIRLGILSIYNRILIIVKLKQCLMNS